MLSCSSHGRLARAAPQARQKLRLHSSCSCILTQSRCLAGRQLLQGRLAAKGDGKESSESPFAIAARFLDSDGTASTNNGKPLQSTTDGEEEEGALMALDRDESMASKYGWLAFWVASAASFGVGIWATEGATKAQEFLAGYLLEQSLSIDNLFVFVVVFNYFKTPPSAQVKVLTYGIGTAAVLRAILIVTGVELVANFEPVLIIFAAILLVSSYKLLTQGDSDEESDLSNNEVVKFCRRFINASGEYDGDKFFTTLADGTRQATPLLLVLAVVELSDVLFAVDSIPAVFGVTLDPFIVYTSNIFAILSLRAVYSFVSTMMMELRFLDKAVASVLGFIGIKMCLAFVDVKIPTDASLAVVALTLAAGVVLSYTFPESAEAGESD